MNNEDKLKEAELILETVLDEDASRQYLTMIKRRNND